MRHLQTAAPGPTAPGRTDQSIKSMKKMLLVLECFSASEPHLAPSAIARRAGLPRATAHRIIQTLRDIGFLEQDRERDQYRLGLKLFELAGFAVGQADLARVAAQPAATLARVTGETVHL
jgi:DNA-binding IclR family transcriptional regulator